MIDVSITSGQLADLVCRLDNGWRIEAPLLQRSILHGPEGRRAVLEVVIRKDGERRVLALSDDLEARQFFEARRVGILAI